MEPNRCPWRLDDGQIEVVDDAVAEVLRRKTPAERVAMLLEANVTLRTLVEGGLRTQHPDWTDEQIRTEVARRMTREPERVPVQSP
jgi:hypothetical protein